MLKRKVDDFLMEWKKDADHNPLIIYGARQIGKTTSIRQFGKSYHQFIEINFVEHPEFKKVFSSFDVDEIVNRISFLNPDLIFEPYNTLILFDEIQEYMDATTSLKFFKQDGRYDVICSGSALGINTSTVSSVSVGFKDEYIMYSLDFEEFLWACGYDGRLTDYLLNCMIQRKPLDDVHYEKLSKLYLDFVVIGGYPRIVSQYFANSRNFGSVLKMQRHLYEDYVDDISKYLSGFDITRAQKVFKSIPNQLAKDNHKFQFSKLGHGARFSEYYSVCDWLKNSGTILIANNCKLQLPLSGNCEEDNFKMYYSDNALLFASLDDETQMDIRINDNFSVYNGAIYESNIAVELTKQNYDLYFYRSQDSTIELDFLIRFKSQIVPIEVKAKQGRQRSLNAVMNDKENGLDFAIKFSDSNIGFANHVLTLPHFMAFLLRRYFDKIR